MSKKQTVIKIISYIVVIFLLLAISAHLKLVTRKLLIVIFLLIILDGFVFSTNGSEIRKPIPSAPITKLYDETLIFKDETDRLVTEFSLYADFNLRHNDLRVAIFKSLDGENIKKYSQSIFNSWHMQESLRHDAILITYFEDEDITYIYTEPKFSKFFAEEVKLNLVNSARFSTENKSKYIDHLVSRTEIEYLNVNRAIEERKSFNLIEKIRYFYHYEQTSFWGIIARAIIAFGIFVYLNSKLFGSKS